jgi:hypothetical protein
VDAMEYDSDGNLVVATHGRGIWESRDPCSLKNPSIPTLAGTYTSTRTVTEGTKVCFCDDDDYLLLALDTTGSGAVIPANGVSLRIGNPSTVSWNSAGGIITNSDGGAIIDRKWNVAPTTQPTNNVEVNYLFTDDEYTSIVSTLAGLTEPTTITSPEQLQFYKLTSTGVFADPHASGATGFVLAHSSSATTSSWTYDSLSEDVHRGVFLVSSFSGGGGGGGGGNTALPVQILFFKAKPSTGHSSKITWQTASEKLNDGFYIQRSMDGKRFESIDFIKGFVNSNQTRNYNYMDKNLPLQHHNFFYRLKQMDLDGTVTYSKVEQVNFTEDLALSVFPNPATDKVYIDTDLTIRGLEVYNSSGQILPYSFDGRVLDVSPYEPGVYFITVITEQSRITKRILVSK